MSLPNELLTVICSFLNINDIPKAALINHTWLGVIKDEFTWEAIGHRLLKITFGTNIIKLWFRAVMHNKAYAVSGLLKAGFNVNVVDEVGYTALHQSAIHGSYEVFQILLDAKAKNVTAGIREVTPIHLAARAGHGAIVNALLRTGIDINSGDKHKCTALMHAVLENQSDVVQTLLRAGAEVNAKDDNSYTALHYASIQDFHSIIQILLDDGADVTLTNTRGETAIYLAIKHEHCESVKILLNAGATVNELYDPEQRTLHIATYKNIIKCRSF